MSSFFETYYAKEKKNLTLLNPKLDFSISSKKFVDWLVKAKECKESEKNNPYHVIVSNMCEYSCLYIAGLLENKKLKGELKICYGEFSCWEHYWISYKLKGVEYFIDLTLAQFIPLADSLSITKAEEAQHTTTYNNFEYISVEEFLSYRRRELDLINSGKVETYEDYFQAQNKNVQNLIDAINSSTIE